MKKKSILIFVLALVGLILLIVFGLKKYIYKQHRDIVSEKPAFILSVEEISEEFSLDNHFANKKYLDKTVLLKGVISGIETDSTLILNDLVYCIFKNSNTSSFNVNDTTIVKGRVVGYDDLFELVQLDQCYVPE